MVGSTVAPVFDTEEEELATNVVVGGDGVTGAPSSARALPLSPLLLLLPDDMIIVAKTATTNSNTIMPAHMRRCFHRWRIPLCPAPKAALSVKALVLRVVMVGVVVVGVPMVV